MDAAILEWIHRLASPSLDGVFRFSHEVATPWACATLVGGMVLWQLLRGHRRLGLAWLALGLAVGWVPEILKAATARPRPDLWPPLVSVSGYSFPSGHASAGTSLFPLLAWMAGRSRPSIAPLAWALALALAAFVGVGRLYLGVHWPSDVLAGWLLGATLYAGVIRWLARPGRGPRSSGPIDEEGPGRGPGKPAERGQTMRDDIQRLLVRELSGFAREIELFPDEASVWKVPPGVSNSAGNLALHVCGNLKHFVGAVLGGTGYVRRREQEFAERGTSRAALLREVQETIEVVSSVLAELPDGALDAPYPEVHGGVQLSGRTFLLHVCTHAAFHLGQAGYLRRALTGDGSTSGALSIKALTGS
jgi:membrane-associated phospholipid phosphatase/uncharacterized damage-inducible protein DinB